MSAAIEKLFNLGDPRELDQDFDDFGWHDYLQYGFTEEDVPELITIVEDVDFHDGEKEGSAIWGQIYAWRTLGQLRSVQAIDPIIAMFNHYQDDDWALTELSKVMGLIGKPAIAALSECLANRENEEFARIMASDSLSEVGKQHPECRDLVLEKLRDYMQSPDQESFDLNGLVVCDLIDLKAVEMIDDIRYMYQQELANITIAGDIEDVEIALGLRDKRDTPQPHYGMLRTPALFDMDDENEPETYVREGAKVGRNEPCPCGSGKKYKRCCLC